KESAMTDADRYVERLVTKYSLDELTALNPEKVRDEVLRMVVADRDAARVAELRAKIPKLGNLSDSLLRAALNGDSTAKAALEYAVTQPAPRGFLAGAFQPKETDFD